jgi:hypothetical protein
MRRQPDFSPQLVPALSGKAAAEGVVYPDETIVGELLDLSGRQAEWFWCGHWLFFLECRIGSGEADPAA